MSLKPSVPRYDDLFTPTLQSLHKLGGSGTVEEIVESIGEIMTLPDDVVNLIHRGNMTKLAYNSAWARNYLKNYGLIENSSRGVWALTAKGREVTSVNKDEVNAYVKNLAKEKTSEHEDTAAVEAPEEADADWRDEIVAALKSMSAAAFERLAQRLLRESGFTQVEVTGRSGDQGIDGRGVLKVGGLLSFRVIFQCKRYKDSVSSPLVRDFRGAMVGRADKGLLITTGTFTRDARMEASRDGAPPIDLIDGLELAEMLKVLGLGVSIQPETIERISVNRDWFDKL